MTTLRSDLKLGVWGGGVIIYSVSIMQDKRQRDYLAKFSFICFKETMKDKHLVLNITGFVKIIIGIVYIPIRESCQTVEDEIYYITLKHEFVKYSTSCHVKFCRDFSSRTGSKNDFIKNLNCSNNPS